MQAIQTKYICPTNYRGSRVKATAQAGSVTLEWDDALDIEENHRAAAQALAVKMGWVGERYGALIEGGTPDGQGNVYVFSGSNALLVAARRLLAVMGGHFPEFALAEAQALRDATDIASKA